MAPSALLGRWGPSVLGAGDLIASPTAEPALLQRGLHGLAMSCCDDRDGRRVATRPPTTCMAVRGCPRMAAAATAATTGLLEPITDETDAST